jgi:hypothetical protein
MKLKTTALIVADSLAATGKRVTTFQLTYPRPIHGELMTHRQFSRNAASSRAIPVAKMIEQVRTDPYIPWHWGANKPGMQAGEDLYAPVTLPVGGQGFGPFPREEAWRQAALCAADMAEGFTRAGYHKQIVNRLLEPFQWMHTIVTATEWDNFWSLRDHHMAEPHFQDLARTMRAAYDFSSPRELRVGDWHVPYVNWQWSACSPGRIMPSQVFMHTVPGTGGWMPLTLEQALKASAARCARVSYKNHDGSLPYLDKDLQLYADLVVRDKGNTDPIHASPTEHQASPDHPCNHGYQHDALHGNLRGWVQHRKLIELGLHPDSHPLNGERETVSRMPPIPARSSLLSTTA